MKKLDLHALPTFYPKIKIYAKVKHKKYLVGIFLVFTNLKLYENLTGWVNFKIQRKCFKWLDLEKG